MKTFDGHCDVLYKMWEKKNDKKLFYMETDELHSSFNRLRKGQVKVQTMAIFVPPKIPNEWKHHAAIQQLDLFYEEILSRSEAVELITELRQLNQIDLNDDKLYVLLHIEGAEPLQGDLIHLRTFYRLGVRSLGFTWNYRNEAADGVYERNAAGLSHFGMDLLNEMNRLKMAVDISHLSEKGFWDCIEHSTQPIMASHCNARALCEHPRNLNDDQIKAIFEQQGLIGVNFYPYFLTKKDCAETKDVLNHVEYMLSLGGENYIGFGSDFDGISETVHGLEHSGKMTDLIEKCHKIYPDHIVQKLCFVNWKQYYNRVWS